MVGCRAVKVRVVENEIVREPFVENTCLIYEMKSTGVFIEIENK